MRLRLSSKRDLVSGLRPSGATSGWSNPGYLIAQAAVKSVSWSGRPLTLDSELLESVVVCSGVSVPSLSLLLFCTPGSCPLSTFALNPAPSQFLTSAPPTAWTNGRAEEACVRKEKGCKSLHTSGQHCSHPELLKHNGRRSGFLSAWDARVVTVSVS